MAKTREEEYFSSTAEVIIDEDDNYYTVSVDFEADVTMQNDCYLDQYNSRYYFTDVVNVKITVKGIEIYDYLANDYIHDKDIIDELTNLIEQ